MNDFPENFDIENREFKFAEQLILYSNRSIYLTGKAGTGKSTFLRYIAKNTTKNYIIVAPTGIAALNAGGMTINSFFQLPFIPFVWELFNDAQKESFYKISQEKREVIKNADLIIIDEISMVRADMIDAIDFRLRNFGGKKNLPFGGKQILFVGDTFQLEPIAKPDEWNILKKYYSSPYFFSAITFKKVEFLNIELKKVYRQKDEKFISLLNKVRINQAQLQDIQELNKSYAPNFSTTEDENYITLATKRDIVDATNLRKIQQLPGKKYSFEGIIEGRFGKENSNNDDLLPTNKKLDLKDDAQVMFVKNDRGGRWVNGSIGKVTELSEESISVVLLKDDKPVSYKIEKAIWENIKYELDEATGKIVEKVVGTFTQYPIKLAWAITIHKSQGLTFDNVIIDLGDGAFTAGHTYVALSRCKTFEGIKLKTLIRPRDIIVREEVLKLSQTANDEKIITSELTNGQANYYYKECLIEFTNSNFELALDNLIKAIEFRNELYNPKFKRFISFKLNQLKNKKRKTDEIEKKIIELENEIEKLNLSLDKKLDRIAELSNELSSITKQSKQYGTKLIESENEIQKLNSSLDKKLDKIAELSNELSSITKQSKHYETKLIEVENEKKNFCSEVQLLKTENVKQKELADSLSQTNAENKIRLENSNTTITNLSEQTKELKLEVSTLRKYALISGFIICIIIIILLIKL